MWFLSHTSCVSSARQLHGQTATILVCVCFGLYRGGFCSGMSCSTVQWAQPGWLTEDTQTTSGLFYLPLIFNVNSVVLFLDVPFHGLSLLPVTSLPLSCFPLERSLHSVQLVPKEPQGFSTILPISQPGMEGSFYSGLSLPDTGAAEMMLQALPLSSLSLRWKNI